MTKLVRTTAVALLAVAWILAACENPFSSRERYPAEDGRLFVEACTAGVSSEVGEAKARRVCRCGLEWLEKNIPYERYQRAVRREQEAGTGSSDILLWYTNIFQACL